MPERSWSVVEVFVYNGNSSVLGAAKVKTPDGVILDGFRIVEGSEGRFVGNPSKKAQNGKYYTTVFFPEEIRDLEQEVHGMIIDAYADEVDARVGYQQRSETRSTQDWYNKGKDAVNKLRQRKQQASNGGKKSKYFDEEAVLEEGTLPSRPAKQQKQDDPEDWGADW